MSFRIPEWKYLKYDIQEWLEHLTLRRWINSKPLIIIAITTLSVIILIVVIVGMLRPNEATRAKNPKKEWYYDLNTGELFVGEANLIAPIDAPSGPLADGKAAGVRAYVLSYIPEPNDSERFIGFLETKDPSYIANNNNGKQKWGQGMLIKRVGDTQWFRADSRQGRIIFQQAFTPNENGENPYHCYPK